MRPIRILHVDDAPTWRGGQQQVLHLHDGLLDRGIDSVVVCRQHAALERRLMEVGLPRWSLPLRGSWDVASALQLGRVAHRWQALVHTHTSHAHGLALLASFLTGRFPLVVSRRVDFPVARSFLGRRKYRSRRVDAYLAISSGVESVLRAGGIDPQRIHLVPSGVDLARFKDVQADLRWRSHLGVPRDRLLLGNVAALAPHKDQATLLEGMARLRSHGLEAHLVILGEGELRHSLEKKVHALGLEQCVSLPGFVDDVLPKMRTFDLYVVSSALEGLGTAMLEAMALGIPVVATRAGGIPDAVREGETGLLFPPRDADALADAVRELADDPQRRLRMGEAARETVRTSFDVQRTINLTVEVYRSLLDEEE